MKSLYHTYVFLLLSVCLSLVACSDDNEAQEDLIEISPEDSTVLSASKGGQTVVRFTTTTDWIASSSGSSWCSISPSSGKAGVAQITITTQENTGYDNREATITLRAGNAQARQIVVQQMQKNAFLVAQDEYEVDDEGGALEFEINTNVADFDVTISADWVKRVTASRGMQPVRLAFQIEPNTDNMPREAVITLSKDDVKQEVKIVQDGYASVSCFVVTHTCPVFNIPLLLGSKLKEGSIQWGDQQTEEYSSDATHAYKDQQEHTVVVEIRGVEEVQLQNLVGVTEIDLTEF